MSVVVSLLRAIDRADGDALVMHVGEKPYVVTAGGHAELAANALTVAAMTGMLDQLLPAESRKALNELGAVEYHLPPDHASPGARYSVVAARGGNDIWIEVRRRRLVDEHAPVPVPRSSAVAVEEPPVRALSEVPPMAAPVAPIAPEEPPPAHDLLETPAVPVPPMEPPATQAVPAPFAIETPESVEEPLEGFELQPPSEEELYTGSLADVELELPATRIDELPPGLDFTTDAEPPPAGSVSTPRAPEVPLARVNVRVDSPAARSAAASPRRHADALHHLLHVAAGQGASALYVAPQAAPSLRVDGEIRVLAEEPLTEEQLETGLRLLLRTAEGAALPTDEIETREVSGVGRVQYLGFRDHRGLGAIFRMLPGRAISSEQAGLPPSVQALCTEPEGLLLVAGPRGAGKSTLVAALVDQINRTRRDHVITVESEIQYVHANQSSFVSQREQRDEQRFADAVRGALREAPDVLVIDGPLNAAVAALALQAAADGQLVIASLAAVTTTAALERFDTLLGQDGQARALTGEHLRGVVTQALLRKTGGGRAAAREVLVNVPAVATLISSAQFDQIVPVLHNGRRVGMVPLNDALLGLVQNGALDVRQAYRKSPDPEELLEMLKRAGFDTSFAERLG